MMLLNCCKAMKSRTRKLNSDQVYEIRQAFDVGGETCREIAKRYPVTETAIHKIGTRATWRSLRERLFELFDEGGAVVPGLKLSIPEWQNHCRANSGKLFCDEDGLLTIRADSQTFDLVEA